MKTTLARKPVTYILAFIILISSIGSLACNESTFKKVAKAEDNLAQGLKSTATLVKDAKDSGVLSQPDVDLLKAILAETANGNGEAITLAKSIYTQYKDNPIPIDEQAKLLNAISSVATQLVRLNNEGVSRIKDPAKRVAFSALIVAMEGAVTSIVIALNIKGSK